MITLKPIITEKSLALQEKGVYQFWAPLTANKNQIASAFETIFGSDALSVRTLIVKGKVKQDFRRRQQIQKPDRKKVYIQTKKDTKIELLSLKTK